VKFSFRQILASAAGAVIAALIASSFGVTGTIVGVAIGSMAATLGTALVSQSIERWHEAVKQAVVRVPEGPASTLLRRMGGTGAAGGTTSSVDGGPKEPEPTEVVGAVGAETTEMEPAATSVDATERAQVPAADVEDDAATEPFEPSTVPLMPTSVLEGAGVVGMTGGAGVATAAGTEDDTARRRFTWKAFAGTAAIVFLLAFGFVTAVELIANRPTVFTPSSPAPATNTTTSTPSTTSTSTSSSTSTSTSSPTSSNTTSTTAPSSATTSTTAPSTTTTTNNLKSSTTTTSTSTPAGP
jgi:hypothetical protein